MLPSYSTYFPNEANQTHRNAFTRAQGESRDGVKISQEKEHKEVKFLTFTETSKCASFAEYWGSRHKRFGLGASKTAKNGCFFEFSVPF